MIFVDAGMAVGPDPDEVAVVLDNADDMMAVNGKFEFLLSAK